MMKLADQMHQLAQEADRLVIGKDVAAAHKVAMDATAKKAKTEREEGRLYDDVENAAMHADCERFYTMAEEVFNDMSPTQRQFDGHILAAMWNQLCKRAGVDRKYKPSKKKKSRLPEDIKLRKLIVTNPQGCSVSVGIVMSTSHYGSSWEFLRGLVDVVRADFPHLTDSEIEPFVVTKSSSCEGMRGVRFHLPLKTKKDGYSQVPSVDFHTT